MDEEAMMGGFFMVRDDAVTVAHVQRNFTVYGNSLQELGEAAAAEATVFYGDLPFRITLLVVSEPTALAHGANRHDYTLVAEAFTESP